MADPAWVDPLDGTRSLTTGGRWNEPGAFPVVYLFSHVDVARSFVIAKHPGLPYSILDLVPTRRPSLVHTEVKPQSFVDVVTDGGCVAAGLPATYPRTRTHQLIGWESCRPIGSATWDRGEAGIACRSASARSGDVGEELAWFSRRQRLRSRTAQTFDEWFPPSPLTQVG